MLIFCFSLYIDCTVLQVDASMKSVSEDVRLISVRLFLRTTEDWKSMKREHDIIQLPNFINPHNSTLKFKKEKHVTFRKPYLFTKTASVDYWVNSVLEFVLEQSRIKNSFVQMKKSTCLTFMVFLGARGKEYIEEIYEMFPQNYDGLMFISSNIDEKFLSNPNYICTDSKLSRSLAGYFNIIDPLGGGNYPLDYLIVIDSSPFMHCKLPLRIGSYNVGHSKFGINLPQLEGLFQEYLISFPEELR
ncbi:hypothetical protein EJF18_30402 [Clavispora lusitaniae]|uniref:Uncharacterized protein n=1 Tax=Clavispora lusitaniae TaxID=36911 RepID=A0ACD0WIY4_CLALS|nr:hypothetical protein EJF14_30402 [Clavispora lusitaniae]QFZ33260.1 hypothetical protein EJF16_30402 [Clavispora lusitaniae]QFZ38931.1 hypothetical protein EJF15_30402 [Clavispora lusitaniae]QFZ44613.1 hypothetical protein EJF18_30402 [Clavispora lusitaniae]QFZ50290.1 hypothetical protein EJF17_30402 [Clavispora lusitaniae]